MTDEAPPRKRHRIRTALISIVVILALLVGGLFVYTSAKDMNGPTFLARYLVTRTSDAGTLFPSRPIDGADSARATPASISPLPARVPWKGKQVTTEKV